VNSLLGFQFVSKTTPFSVYKFLQSLLIFIVTCICSVSDSQTSYLVFFCISYAFALFSWVFLAKCFKVLPRSEVLKMRKEARAAAAATASKDDDIVSVSPVCTTTEGSDLKTTLKTAKFGASEAMYTSMTNQPEGGHFDQKA